MPEPAGQLDIQETEVIWEGWSSLVRYTYAFTALDGERKSAVVEVSDHGDGVAILPFDPVRRTVILIRQLRLPAVLNGHPEPLWEACAGLIEEGETPERTALRELAEETGLYAGALEPAGAVFTCPGSLTERLHLYFAEYGPADRRGDGGGQDVEGEDIEVHELPLRDAVRMLDEGEIADAKTAVLLRTLQLRRPDLLG